MIDGPILVTGGIGFIGSSLVRHLRRAGVPVVVLDAMTYAANPLTAVDFEADSDCRVVVGRIEDRALVASLLEEVRPIAIVNLAAESPVDGSIDGPSSSMYSNSIGVFEMLEAVRAGRAKLANDFRFIRHFPANLQIHGNRIYIAPPRELHSLRSPPMTRLWRADHVRKAIWQRFPPSRHSSPVFSTLPSISSAYAGTGLRRRSSIKAKIFWNKIFDTATSASWNVT